MTTAAYKYHKFDISNSKIAASGNIMFLMDKTGELRDLSGKNYCYCNIFHGCSSLTQAPELPATTLADYCYCNMFSGCTSLTQAPELPATTLVDYCYESMFYRCSSLTQAPELPATTLADYCYGSIFSECTSLTNAYFPKLDSETVINEVVENQYAFYDAAPNIETQCLDITIIINSTSV